MSVEYWWNDNDRRTRLRTCSSTTVHHRSYVDKPGIELWPRQWDADDQPPEWRHGVGECCDIQYGRKTV